jgi:hypothetical protein
MAPVFERLTGIRALADSARFKAWFLDQIGVLHHGNMPYLVPSLHWERGEDGYH